MFQGPGDIACSCTELHTQVSIHMEAHIHIHTRADRNRVDAHGSVWVPCTGAHAHEDFTQKPVPTRTPAQWDPQCMPGLKLSQQKRTWGPWVTVSPESTGSVPTGMWGAGCNACKGLSLRGYSPASSHKLHDVQASDKTHVLWQQRWEGPMGHALDTRG